MLITGQAINALRRPNHRTPTRTITRKETLNPLRRTGYRRALVPSLANWADRNEVTETPAFRRLNNHRAIRPTFRRSNRLYTICNGNPLCMNHRVIHTQKRFRKF